VVRPAARMAVARHVRPHTFPNATQSETSGSLSSSISKLDLIRFQLERRAFLLTGLLDGGEEVADQFIRQNWINHPVANQYRRRSTGTASPHRACENIYALQAATPQGKARA
jgi:hypothetical protein